MQLIKSATPLAEADHFSLHPCNYMGGIEKWRYVPNLLAIIRLDVALPQQASIRLT